MDASKLPPRSDQWPPGEKRFKNAVWFIPDDENGLTPTDAAQVAVLMDIREQLQLLNRLLSCRNFLDIPFVLKGIRRNTTRPKRKK